MNSLITKIATVLSHPGIGVEYAEWCRQSLLLRSPVRNLYGITIGDFANFSEYHSVTAFLDEAKLGFLLEHQFGEGDIIDIGANVGVISLILAKRFPERHIHAIEPNPSTFSALTSNILRNTANNITAYDVAISESSGSILFDADPQARGTASISSEIGQNVISVKTQTLDAFAETVGANQIALLKVDVEGFETLVFAGASHVLQIVKPAAIVFEVCPALTITRGFDATVPAKRLQDLGYKLFRWGEKGQLNLATHDDIKNVQYEDWLAVPW
jgi:FkbM family methyltransferase